MFSLTLFPRRALVSENAERLGNYCCRFGIGPAPAMTLFAKSGSQSMCHRSFMFEPAEPPVAQKIHGFVDDVLALLASEDRGFLPPCKADRILATIAIGAIAQPPDPAPVALGFP